MFCHQTAAGTLIDDDNVVVVDDDDDDNDDDDNNDDDNDNDDVNDGLFLFTYIHISTLHFKFEIKKIPYIYTVFHVIPKYNHTATISL